MRAWDYHPQGGLVIAGGISRWSIKAEISKNYGETFTSLPNIPYMEFRNWGLAGACFVIIDADTAMLIGGYFHSGGYFFEIIIFKSEQSLFVFYTRMK